jgi:FkbM family methyltransferase
MRVPRPRLNVIELAMWASLVAVLAYYGGRYRTEARLSPFLSAGGTELRLLGERYHFAQHSEHGEEWLIRDFFGDERGGVFVDVGANHYERDSNTYFLETELGWSGLAIEPQKKFAADYTARRPHTRFIPLFVSDASNRDAILYVPKNDLLASSTKAVAQSEGENDPVPVHTNTTTLDDILERSAIARLDFLSIDVELHEPQVLKGFSIDRYKPRLVCVEAHASVRQQILDYFAGRGYVIVGKYLRADSENLWFTPVRVLSEDTTAAR